MRFFLPLLVLLFSNVAAAAPEQHNSTPFSAWLDELRQDALAKGISQRTIDSALSDIEPIDEVVTLDRKQPESKLTFQQYLDRVITQTRIDQGRELYAEHKELLERIGREYGVQPQYIVALWGIESSFGERMGEFPIVQSLATLAYDGRRSSFFRGELMNALKIIDNGDIDAFDMTGSWAGAMGQCQFMPSSYLRFAVDEDGDGKRDIWGTQADIFASIANYLSSSGWNGDEGWGMAVQPAAGGARNDIETAKPLSHWKRSGVMLSDGDPLPDEDIESSFILVGEGENASPYIVYNNYKVLLKWNRSRYFATAVGNLADSIAQ